ncbi:MAG: redoxin domain-containing protein [Gammaproteobacteria bacterium]|nr:redoxin domain-containing protein [Gammaproteobacteria bacterium]MDP2140650.1 redoxin domain-containing protein [Gammaproteobacteria bacterium]MDP2347422.1 redoxin domain-containing protein [Gammaproteobacteria bacterium]
MMRIFNALALLISLGITSLHANAAPERVGDFNLIDQEGSAHQLSKYAYQKAVVFISLANSCSLNQKDFTEYKILKTKLEPLGVSVVMLNASSKDDVNSVRRLHDTFNIELPVLLDDTQLVAESLKISKAGEIVVIDPKRMFVLYRGPLDTPPRGGGRVPGTTYIVDAVQAAQSDTRNVDTVVVDFEAPADCQLEFPARQLHAQNVPDYETEVAPILIERCTGCHIDGGIGPFAMNSHQMIQGWSPMIREVLLTKRMPPAQVDPSIRHFNNARNMPDEEVQTLVHWIDAGAPRE